MLLVVVFAITLVLIVADFTTWIELDIATIYGLPLVLAGATRSRALLWMLTGSLTATTFAVYVLQVPAGTFTLQEPYFVNRVLNALSLLLLAGLLHIWIRSAATNEAQARLIKEQNEKLQAAHVSRRMVEVQEAERRNVANHLHDVVGQKLTALSINLNIVKGQLLPSPAEPIGVRLDDSLKVVEETTESIRDVIAELRPAVLDDFGLAPALHWYADQFTQRTGVEVVSDKSVTTIPRLDPSIEMTLLRIAQEALTNVARHAQASKATVSIKVEDRTVYMSIQDDGIGILSWQKANQPGSHGLRIIRERAEAFGGSLSVHSTYKKGTRIEVKIPLYSASPHKVSREWRS